MTVAKSSLPRKAGTIQGLALILPVTLSVMGAVLLTPIVPKLMAQFQAVPNAHYWVPTLLSVPALCIALFSPVAGGLADKVGRRRMLILAMAIYAVCGMAPIFLDNFYAVYATRIGVGICEAFVLVCSTALIGDFFKGDQRNKWIGSQTALASTTALCLIPLAGALGTFGWKGPFFIYGLSLFWLFGVIIFTWEKGNIDDDSPDVQQRPVAGDVVFPWGHMLLVCTMTLIASIMFYVLQFQMSTALLAFNIESSFMSGILLAVATLANPIGALTFRYVHKKVSRPSLIAVEFGLFSVGFLGLTYAPNVFLFTLSGFVHQFGAGMVLPTMLTWAMSGLAFEVRGRGVGMWQSTYACGQFVSSLSFSFISAKIGGTNQSFQLFGFVAIFICLFAVIGRLKMGNKK